MKVLIVGDIHWSTYSSIVRSRGNYFSTRLEYLIKSLSWVEQISEEYGCQEEIFLGDTFDKPELSAEELTALSEVHWNKSARLKHFIVGNHESGVANLKYNSTQALYKLGVVEDTPYIYPLDDKTDFLILPYITEDNRKPLEEYLKNRNPNKKLVAFSHNDIKDFQMGPFISKTGFTMDEICRLTDLYINGHLHNGGWVKANKILNLGVLCGQNFSEDASKYEHHVAVLDTDTLELTFIENPYALNFYKIDINSLKDLHKLSKLKPNSVLSIKCLDTYKEELKQALEGLKDVTTYKIVYTRDSAALDGSGDLVELNTKDHLEQFKEYILETLGTSEVVQEELMEVCK